MARRARHVDDNVIYRIRALGRPHGLLFREPPDYAAYLTGLSHAKRFTRVRVYHYCLLRNEVHLVVHVPVAPMLATTLHHAHTMFRWHHRKRYRSKGSLWYDRFHHTRIAPEDALHVGHAMERLPMRAGLSSHPADYPYSSHAYYALGEPNPSVDAAPHYLALGCDPHHRRIRYWRLSDRHHEKIEPVHFSGK